MAFPLVLVIGIVFFAVQLLLCFRARKQWLRLGPLALVSVAEAVSGVTYFLTRDSSISAIEVLFTIYILAVVGLVWLAALVLAWVVYAIVKTVQKRRK